jgi:hypothetical protein
MTKPTFVILFTILAGFYLSSCHDHENFIQNLQGTWIEVDTQTDTIVFSSNSKSGDFILYRGYEIRNGYNLPKLGSGPYAYTINKDSINVISLLSSSYSRNYYFKFNESSMTFNIGLFTFFATNKAILTFVKIK